MVRVIIGGDLVPTKSNYEKFEQADIEYLFGTELCNKLERADERIFNLEVPIVDEASPIKKCGPNLLIPTNVIKGIKKLNPTCVTLANNHILDQGEYGLDSTIQILKENEIGFVGAGKNVTEASKPYIIEQNGISIGVYACAEHEFSIANKDKAGANPFDVLESYAHIRELKDKVDYVIVLYHGGKEHYRYPSPNLQRYCRKFVDCGADLIVCQHSHCVGCEEQYENGTIVYGQGNFMFDDGNGQYWSNSLVLDVCFEKENMHIEYIPLRKNAERTAIADEAFGKEVLSGFYQRSREILQEGFVEAHYKEFAASQLQNNIWRVDCFSRSIFFRVINKLTKGYMSKWYYEKIFVPKMKYVLTNVLECEAWHEMMLCGIKAKTEEDEI